MRVERDEVSIQSVIFRPDDLLEVSYMEDRDQSELAGLFKTIIIARELAPVAVDEILDSLRDLVDDALIAIRNPQPPAPPSAPAQPEDDEGHGD